MIIAKGEKHLDKRRFITISVMLFMIVGFSMPLTAKAMPSWEENIEEYWNVNLPTSCKEEKIVRYRGFYNNGVSYIVFKYTKREDIELISERMDWSKKDYFIEQKAEQALAVLKEWYEITQEEHNKLNRYSQKLKNKYEYCYFEEKDGVSYSVFVWLEDLGELHIIELTY